MLFITNIRIKDLFYTLPMEEQIKRAAGTRAFGEKYVKLGKFKGYYASVDLKRFVVIWEADSVEDAARVFADHPNANFIEYDSFPVIEYRDYIKIITEVREAQQKAPNK